MVSIHLLVLLTMTMKMINGEYPSTVLLTMTMKMINGEYPSTGSVDDDNEDD